MWDKLAAPGSYPCLLLTTTGRRSQLPRTTPLVYGRDGDNYTAIASQGGKPTHPAWYLNLAANPWVELQVGAEAGRGRGGRSGAQTHVDVQGHAVGGHGRIARSSGDLELALDGQPVHEDGATRDELAAAVLVDESFAVFARSWLVVEFSDPETAGWTRVTPEGASVRVVTSVRRLAFERLLLESLVGGPAELEY